MALVVVFDTVFFSRGVPVKQLSSGVQRIYFGNFPFQRVYNIIRVSIRRVFFFQLTHAVRFYECLELGRQKREDESTAAA